jgi:putative ABC transport system permease protein
VGLHYFQLTLIITLLGALIGIGLGVWLGGHMTALYLKFYRMPNMTFQMDMRLLSTSLMVSLGAGLLGSLVSVRRVIRLPPAEAMRPLAPPTYAQGGFTRALIGQLSPSARMVAREITRRPMRTLLSAVGIGAATGIIVVGQHFADALHYLVDFYLQTQQREAIFVGFLSPVSPDAVQALRALPGVYDVQWQATIQVRLRAGARSRDVPLVSHPARHGMRPLIDDLGREVPIPPGSVLFTDVLARVLDVAPGDEVIAEPLEGARRAACV